jgi:hypothetical protein
MGGGILPIALHKGKLYFLFGKEVYNGQWGDFGGGREGKETQFQTAIREGCEELDGFFGCQNALKKRVTEDLIATVTTEGLKTFIFEVEYDDRLPEYFNNHHQFIKNKLSNLVNKKGLFEKSQIKWFTTAELKKNKSQFRSFYKKVVDNILKNTSKMMYELKTN